MRTCSIPDCNKKHHARNYCHVHYQRWLRGRPLNNRLKNKKCSAEGCKSDHYGLGYCRFHYQRHKKGIPFDQPRQTRTYYEGCSVQGCEGNHKSKTFCDLHYQRHKSGRDVHNPLYNGTKPVGTLKSDGHGYMLMKTFDGWERYHTVVMEVMLKRRLKPNENTHHKDGRRSNNHPSNLELWHVGQPAGQRAKDKVAWAVKLIQQYPEIAGPMLNPQCVQS